MKKVALFIFVLLMSGAFSHLFSQPKENTGLLSLKIGRIPFIMEETKIDALTNDKADKSPVKSIIRLDQPAMDNIMGLTLSYFNPTNFLNIELSYYDNGTSPITGLEGGLGFRPTKVISSKMNVHVGGNVNVALFMGKVGEVGERSGDVYLTAPDGNDYYVGSKIEVSGWAYGGSLFAGVEFPVAPNIGITSDFGYRIFTKIEDWKYEVSCKDEDDDDKKKSCKLPADGIEQHPSDLTLSGFFFRVGLSAYF